MTMHQSKPLPDLDYDALDREFSKTKTRVFLGKNAAFLGSIMSSLNFSWTMDVKTACTNGIQLNWNPLFFLKLPQETRDTILVHELWHPARLDMIRVGNRDRLFWNYASDISINNGLHNDGYSFKGFRPWLDHAYDNWVTEDIYDDLYSRKIDVKAKYGAHVWGYVDPEDGEGDKADLVEPDDLDQIGRHNHQIVNIVVSATHQAKLAGETPPSEIETTLQRFLQPKLPWEVILYNFFNELDNQAFSWKRPNRRHSDIYLPGMVDDREALDHLMYFEDVSGSISDADAIRFLSEFKHVKETFRPKKMTMVQFDDQIQKVDVFLDEDPFDEVKIVGRGGTDLAPVRQYIIDHKPTAVVIFSDLCCAPMEKLDIEIPIIWVALNNRSAVVPHGQIVHLQE